MKTKKDNKTLVWELDRYKQVYGYSEGSRMEAIEYEQEDQQEMLPPSERRNNKNYNIDLEAGIHQDIEDSEVQVQPKSLPYDYEQQEQEIRAIMGPDHNPVVEEIENSNTEEQRAVTLYGDSNNFYNQSQSFDDVQSKLAYYQEGNFKIKVFEIVQTHMCLMNLNILIYYRKCSS